MSLPTSTLPTDKDSPEPVPLLIVPFTSSFAKGLLVPIPNPVEVRRICSEPLTAHVCAQPLGVLYPTTEAAPKVIEKSVAPVL